MSRRIASKFLALALRPTNSGTALLFMVCAVAMVLALSLAPSSRPTTGKQFQAETQAPVALRGRSRQTMGVRPRRTETISHTPHDLAALPFTSLTIVADSAASIWALTPYALRLPQAAHPVFTPPISL